MQEKDNAAGDSMLAAYKQFAADFKFPLLLV